MTRATASGGPSTYEVRPAAINGCAIRCVLGTLTSGDVKAELYQLADDLAGPSYGYKVWNEDMVLEIRTGCRSLAQALAWARGPLSCGDES